MANDYKIPVILNMFIGYIEAGDIAITLRSLNPAPDQHLVAKEISKVAETYGGRI